MKISKEHLLNLYVHIISGPVAGWRVGMQLRVFTGALGMLQINKVCFDIRHYMNHILSDLFPN